MARLPMRWVIRAASMVAMLVSAVFSAAHAQTPSPRLLISGDLAYANEYVWRGLVRANRPIVAADLYTTYSLGRVDLGSIHLKGIGLSGGVWGAMQLGGADADRFGDLEDTGVAEINPWFQASALAGAADLSLGVTRYFYRGDSEAPRARTDDANSTELFSRLGVRGERVSASLTWWWDVEEVQGSYLESTISLNLPLMPIPLPVPLLRIDPMLGNLFLDVTAGWSAGQGVNDSEPGQAAHFVGEGLTHIDFALSSSILIAGAVSIDPSFHLQVSRDDATERLRPTSTSGLNVWYGVVVRPVSLATLGEDEG